MAFLALVVMGCGESAEEIGEPLEPSTVLVNVVEVVEAELIFDGETPRAMRVDDRRVTLVYETGSCGTASDAPRLPAGVAARYSPEVVAFTIDKTINCRGADVEDASHEATIEVSTTEDLRDRELTVTYGVVSP